MRVLPRIRTERLLLIPFDLSDIPRLYRLWNEEEMRRFFGGGEETTMQETEDAVRKAVLLAEDKGIGMWRIHHQQAETTLMGFCGLRNIAATTKVELMYGLLQPYWKQGYATEASWAVLAYLFRIIGATSVYAGSDPVNVPSFGVMKRLGMSPLPDGSVPVPGAAYYIIDGCEFEKYSLLKQLVLSPSSESDAGYTYKFQQSGG